LKARPDGLCRRIRSGGQFESEAGEAADVGGADGSFRPPGVEAAEVESGGDQHMTEAGLVRPAVGGGACPCRPDGLGDGAFDSGAGAVGGPLLAGVLLASALVEGLLLGPGEQG